jgi:predicted alpha/beta superfamily hydrolase
MIHQQRNDQPLSLHNSASQRSLHNEKENLMNPFFSISYSFSRGLHQVVAAIFMILFLSAHIFSQEKTSPSAQPPEVEIAGTQLLTIHSSIANQEYVLDINLPRGYDDTTKAFPVLYLLDAQWDFPLIQALYGQQYYDGFVPGIVIVGITWGGNNPDYDKLRARDLTPTDINHNGQFGNAQNFLAFITQELIPFIESKYRVKKDDRTLVGSSFGGLFTLYALFHEPDTFKRCILTSPALGWDNNLVYTYNAEFSKKRKDLPVRLFMGIGEYEDVPDFQKFIDQLKSKNYKGFELEAKVLEGMGHSGGKAEGFTRGLQFVYEKPSLKLAPEALDQYIGEYEINPQFHVTIEREDDHLVGIAPNNPKIVVHAESEVDFYVNGAFFRIHFQKDDKGKVTGFQMEQYNGGGFAKKVK